MVAVYGHLEFCSDYQKNFPKNLQFHSASADAGFRKGQLADSDLTSPLSVAADRLGSRLAI